MFISQCSDGTLHTGITTDINRELRHIIKVKVLNIPRPTPVVLMVSFESTDRSTASKEEYRLNS
jgi:predicted GIY-YIG superfamily endonuclease